MCARVRHVECVSQDCASNKASDTAIDVAMNEASSDRAAVTVIIADGEAPSHAVPLSFLFDAETVVACDGAWSTAVKLGRVPDAVVGDGDSLAAADRAELERLGVPVFKDVEQDTNDLCKAFRHVMRSGRQGRVVILGATGRREDHAIGNIFHLADFAEANPDVLIVTDSGMFEPLMPPGRAWDGDSNVGSPISVFATHPDTVMASNGLKWPLDGVRFDTLWRGTLNRIVSTCFSISTDRPAIIFRPHAGPEKW